MRFTLPAASFLALALFAVPSLAQGQPEMLVAQASAVPAEVQALLDDKRPLSELTVKELTQRIRLGRGFMRSGKLPRDVQRQLRTVLKAAATERATRSEAGGQAPAKPAAEDTANTGAGTADATAEPDMTAAYMAKAAE